MFDFATQAASGGDNAENMGTGPTAPEEEGDEETSGSDWDGLNWEGDTSSLSDGTSSDEADDERYKELEELFGKIIQFSRALRFTLTHAGGGGNC